MRKVYHKLIRDKIPEIIEKAGEKPKVRKLKKAEFLLELKKKILEEAKELQSTENKKEISDEIVDIQELLDWLIKELKISQSKIKTLQVKKNQKRGSFKKRLYLMYTKTKL